MNGSPLAETLTNYGGLRKKSVQSIFSDMKHMMCKNESHLVAKTYNFRVLAGERSVYVVINFANEPQTVNLDAFENVSRDVLLYHTTSDAGAPVE